MTERESVWEREREKERGVCVYKRVWGSFVLSCLAFLRLWKFVEDTYLHTHTPTHSFTHSYTHTHKCSHSKRTTNNKGLLNARWSVHCSSNERHKSDWLTLLPSCQMGLVAELRPLSIISPFIFLNGLATAKKWIDLSFFSEKEADSWFFSARLFWSKNSWVTR